MPHSEVVKLLVKSPILLLPLNDTPNVLGIVPGKLFEYMAARRPIFSIGNLNGDTASIIKETESGTMVDFKDYDGTKNAILDLYQKFKTNQLFINSSSIDKYSRENCAKDYAALLNEIAK
jgi:glycosyltransferase involved in cell wall biosynthesis